MTLHCTNRFRAGMVVLAALALSTPSGFAACDPAKSFATFNTVEEPGLAFYVHWGPGSEQNSNDILGRFWQPRSRAFVNEGTYDDSRWLPESTSSPDLDMWYLDGNLGDAGVVGCPASELIVIGQNVTVDRADALFFAARVDETPGRSVDFDFSRQQRELDAIPIPAPQILNVKQRGKVVDVRLRLGDPGAGFYGMPGMDPAATITGIQVYSYLLFDRTPPPGRLLSDVSGWQLAGTARYTGEDALVDVTVACTVGGGFHLGAVLVFDGDVVGDYVGRDVRVPCTPRGGKGLKSKGKP